MSLLLDAGPGATPTAALPERQVAIAVLSWTWATMAVGATPAVSTGSSGWSDPGLLAPHPSDARLLAHLAGAWR